MAILFTSIYVSVERRPVIHSLSPMFPATFLTYTGKGEGSHSALLCHTIRPRFYLLWMMISTYSTPHLMYLESLHPPFGTTWHAQDRIQCLDFLLSRAHVSSALSRAYILGLVSSHSTQPCIRMISFRYTRLRWYDRSVALISRARRQGSPP